MQGGFKRLIFLILIFSLSLTACSQDKLVQSNAYSVMLKALLSHSVEEASVSDFLNTSSNVHFLDAREQNEYDVSHIRGAAWVGYDDFSLERVEELQPTDTILVYCSVGYRSEKVSEQLVEAGFQYVKNLYGGIFEWKNRGGEVVDTAGKSTESVHAFDKAWGVWLRKGKKVYN